MAKRKKPSRQGRSGDPRKRATEQDRSRAEATPELEDEVAAALAGSHPIAIVMLASSLIASVDPALDRPEKDELPPPDEFVRMFLDTADPDLMVLAWVVAQLLSDPRLQVEVDLAVPAEIVPDWLRALPETRVTTAWQTTDALQDSSDIVLSLRIGEADLSVIVLFDLNAGGAVKDAFAIPAPLAAVHEALSARGQTPMVSRDLDPAEAAAWLSQGSEVGRGLDVPFETDTWPQLRPLLEWAVGLCPPGGEGWRPPSWTTEETEAVVADFAASAAGGVAADPQDQAVLVAALQLLGRYTEADPLLLSAVRLEIGLGYLWSTALHFDRDRLLNLPEMLVPYVRWAHARRGVPADDTDEALAAIAHRRAEYVRDVTAVAGVGDDDAD